MQQTIGYKKRKRDIQQTIGYKKRKRDMQRTIGYNKNEEDSSRRFIYHFLQHFLAWLVVLHIFPFLPSLSGTFLAPTALIIDHLRNDVMQHKSN